MRLHRAGRIPRPRRCRRDTDHVEEADRDRHRQDDPAGQIFGIPGQQVLVQLSGKVENFPATTTDPNTIIVQEPADLADDEWFDHFSALGVANAPIPANSTLTVQYWDGTEWVDVPGMVDLAGPQIFSGFPGTRSCRRAGHPVRLPLRRWLPARHRGQPQPRVHAEGTRPDGADHRRRLRVLQRLRRRRGRRPGRPACDDIHIVPPTPGNADFIDKSWDDPATVAERSQQQKGATIAWSTDGATGIDHGHLRHPGHARAVGGRPALQRLRQLRPGPDRPDHGDRRPATEVRPDPVGPAVQRLSGAWIDAPGDPCPAACDKTFPGYTLSADSRDDTIAFRLTYAESPNRVWTRGRPADRQRRRHLVENKRHLHPVFQIRDDLRSDPNGAGARRGRVQHRRQTGVVRNTAQARLVVEDNEDSTTRTPRRHRHHPGNVTSNITKDWTGGPLGVPAPGTARFPDEYPTANVTLKGTNTTPSKVDRSPSPTPRTGHRSVRELQPRRLHGITDPASIGATGLTITLKLAGGGTGR